MESLSIVLLAVLGTLALYYLGATPNRRAHLHAIVGILLILGATSQLIEGSSLFAPMILRVLGVALLLTVAYLPAFRSVTRHDTHVPSFFHATGPFILVYICVAYILHGFIEGGVLYIFGTLLFVGACTAGARLQVAFALEKVTVCAIGFALVSSIAVGVLDPALGVENGRLRGLLGNANTLGFYAFVMGTLVVTMRMRLLVRITFLFVTLSALAWSGSRASLIAFAVFAAVAILRGIRGRRFLMRFLILAPFAVTLLALLVGYSTDLVAVLARENTRSESFSYAIEVLLASPIVGAGVSAEEMPRIAGTLVVAAAHAGLIGLLSMVGLYWCVIRLGLRVGWEVATLSFTAVFHSLFESWLLSPISPQLFVFTFSWYSMVRVTRLRGLSTIGGVDAS